jgi:hypothetical protein
MIPNMLDKWKGQDWCNEWPQYLSTIHYLPSSIIRLMAKKFANGEVPPGSVGMWWYHQAKDALTPDTPVENLFLEEEEIYEVAASMLMAEADRREEVEKRGRYYLKVGSQSLSRDDLKFGRKLLKELRQKEKDMKPKSYKPHAKSCRTCKHLAGSFPTAFFMKTQKESFHCTRLDPVPRLDADTPFSSDFKTRQANWRRRTKVSLDGCCDEHEPHSRA